MKHPDMIGRRDKQPKGDKKATTETKAFDIWLNRGLHQIYDDVAKEPVPEELLKLIEDDRNVK